MLNITNPTIDKLTPEKERKRKRLVINILWLFMILYGISSSLEAQYPSFTNFMDIAVLPMLIATAFSWHIYDLRAKGIFIDYGWALGIVLLTPIVLPLYFYSTRGIKGGSILIFKTLFILFISVVTLMVGGQLGEFIKT